MSKIYGYDKINEKIEVNKQEQKIILEIFERFQNGENYRSITRDFKDRGITTVNGKEWRSEGLRRILSNEIYTGKGNYEKFIDYEKYVTNKNKVLEIAEKNANKSNRKRLSDAHIFSHKLICDECGSVLPKQGDYYACSKQNKVHHLRKVFKYVNIAELEKNCLQVFLKLQSNNTPIFNNIEEVRQINKIKNLDRKIKEAVSENENIEIIQNLIREKTEATYIHHSQFINPTEILLDGLKDTEKIKELDKKFYRQLIEKIICHTDGTYEFYFINKSHIKVKDCEILKG